jgi:phage tail P2-like protein
MISDLMPLNSTRLERALDHAVDTRLPFAFDLPAVINPNACPTVFLPWLAWMVSLDQWDAVWAEDVKRSAIAQSISQHRLKGSVGSIKRFLQSVGYGDAVIDEGTGNAIHDGTLLRDGSYTRGGASASFEYTLTIPRAMTIAQRNQLEAWVRQVAPARSILTNIIYNQAAHLHNRVATRNNTITRGIV